MNSNSYGAINAAIVQVLMYLSLIVLSVSTASLAYASVWYYLIGDHRQGEAYLSFIVAAVSFAVAVALSVVYRKYELSQQIGLSRVISAFAIGVSVFMAIVGFSMFGFVMISIGGIVEPDYARYFSYLIGSALLVFTAIRIAKPTLRGYYYTILIVLALPLIICAAFGPFPHSLSTRGDKVMERGLPYIQSGIDRYYVANNRLPSSISDINLDNKDAKRLIAENLVEYSQDLSQADKVGYSLCVDYAKPRQMTFSDMTGSYEYIAEQQGGMTTDEHPAGEKCYKLTVGRDSSPNS